MKNIEIFAEHSHNQMRLVGTFTCVRDLNDFTCICFVSSNFFSAITFALGMSFVVQSYILKRGLNIHKLREKTVILST
jgi:hypothetical protein